MIMSRLSSALLGIGILFSLAPAADVYAGGDSPSCKVTVYNCHSSMDLVVVRTYDPFVEFKDVFAVQESGRVKPGQTTTLDCKTNSGCRTAIWLDRQQTGSIAQSAFLESQGPLFTNCNSDLAFAWRAETFDAYRNCSSPK